MNDASPIQETLEYDPQEDRYRAEFTGPPSMAVVSLIGAITGTDPTELDALEQTVDSEALDAVLCDSPISSYRGDRHVRFTYHGFEVTIHSYGIIEARPVDGEHADDLPAE